jgi:hypothetical protein
MTAYKILRDGYFWPTLFTDVCTKVRAYVKCQRFSGKQQLKSLPLKPVVASGPFQQWGLDFIGEIHPASSGQHRWILTATDYFTKWIEAIPTRSASHRVIIGFLEDIIARFGCPSRIMLSHEVVKARRHVSIYPSLYPCPIFIIFVGHVLIFPPFVVGRAIFCLPFLF